MQVPHPVETEPSTILCSDKSPLRDPMNRGGSSRPRALRDFENGELAPGPDRGPVGPSALRTSPREARRTIRDELCKRRTGGEPSGSRTAHNSDLLAEGPLLDEVLTPCHTQRNAHGRLGSIDRLHHLRLDFPSLLGKVDQHDITHLESLHDVLHRHQTSVFGCRIATQSDAARSTNPGGVDPRPALHTPLPVSA